MSNNKNNNNDNINNKNNWISNFNSFNDINDNTINNSINNLSINESNNSNYKIISSNNNNLINSNLISSKSTEYSSVIDYENNEKIFEYIYENIKEKKIKNSIIILDEEQQNKYIYEKIIKNIYNINEDKNKENNKICFLILDLKKLEKFSEELKLIFKDKKISILKGGKGKKKKNDYDIFINFFKETDIFVAIPDVFYKLLSIGFINIFQFNILFLDDCHLCDGNHPYNLIMQEFYYYYLYRQHILNINNSYSLPNIIGFSDSSFLYDKIINKDDKSQKLLTNISENLNCQIVISPQILLKNENIQYKNNENIENIEYINIKNHLSNNNIDIVYKILNHYFIEKTFKKSLPKNIKKEDSLIKNYLDIIHKKFYSKDKEEYIKIESESSQQNIISILKSSYMFIIFEDILKYLIIIFQYLDIQEIKDFFVKYLNLLQNILLNNLINIKITKEEIEYLCGIIKDTINAFEYLLKNKIKYDNDRKEKFISKIENIYKNKNNAKILIFVSSRKLAFLLNDILIRYKYKSEYIIGINTKKEETFKISLLTKTTYNIINEINNKYNSDDINILICTSSIIDNLNINKCDYIIIFEELSNLNFDYIKIKKLSKNKNAELIIISNNSNNIENIFKEEENKSSILIENNEISKDYRKNNYINEKMKIIEKNKYYFIEETNAKASIKNSIILFNDINNLFITQNKKLIIDKFLDEYLVGKIKKYKCKIELDKTFGNTKIFSQSYGDKQSAEGDCLLQLISFLHKYGMIDNNFRILDSQ